MEQQQNHEDAGPHESSGEAGSSAGGAVSPRLNDFLAYSLAYSLSDVPHLPAISSQKAFPDLFGPHHCKKQIFHFSLRTAPLSRDLVSSPWGGGLFRVKIESSGEGFTAGCQKRQYVKQ